MEDFGPKEEVGETYNSSKLGFILEGLDKGFGDSAIGDANGALEQERFWVMAPPPPAPFRFPSPSCSRMVAACEFACRIHRRQTPGSSVSCMRGNSPRKCFYHGGSAKPELRSASAAAARRCKDGTGPQADCKTSRSFVAGDDDEQARGGAEAPGPEFSVVFRFRAYSRRHETEPESISPQDVLRPGGRRARWLLRDGAVQRQSAVRVYVL